MTWSKETIEDGTITRETFVERFGFTPEDSIRRGYKTLRTFGSHETAVRGIAQGSVARVWGFTVADVEAMVKA